MLTRLQCSEISFSLHWDRLWRRQSAIDRFPLKSVPKKKKFIMVETSLKIKESMMGALRHVNIVLRQDLPVRWAYSPTSKNLWICVTDVLPTKMKITTTKHDSQRTSQWQRKTHLEQPKTLGPRDNTQLEWQRQWHVSRLLIMMTIGWNWWWAELAWSLKLFDTTVIVLLRNCFAPTTHTIMIFFSIPADPID